MAKKINEEFEQAFLDIIEERAEGVWPTTARFMLRSLSMVFVGVAQSRIWMYKNAVLRYHTLGCQVISVGNLTAGGTGKTPVVETFARALTQNGRNVAILSRGYKKKKKPFSERLKAKIRRNAEKEVVADGVVSDGTTLRMDSESSGDEPFMLARNLKTVPVIVGSNRVRSGRHAIRHFNTDTIILDDGFQHLKLKQHVRIVLVDSTNPFSNGYTLPRGLLREPVKNIRRADYIFITKSKGDGSPELRKTLRALNAHAEITECRHAAKYYQHIRSGERMDLDSLKEKRIFALSGIARPLGFQQELERQGAEVIVHRTFTDHHRYTRKELSEFFMAAIQNGADAVVTTEKDAVRIPNDIDLEIPVLFLRVEIEMLSGEKNFHDWISRICFDG